MSLGQWVLVGLGIWVVVALVLGLLVARVLRSVGEQDESQHRPEPAEPPVGHLDAAAPGDTDLPPHDGDHDEVARARERRRETG